VSNELQKLESINLPALPMLDDLIPSLPKVSADDNIIKQVGNRLKLRYIEKATERTAAISQKAAEATHSRIEQMITIMTASKRYEEALKKFETSIQLLDLNVHMQYELYQQEKIKTQQEAIKKEMMEVELETAKLVQKQQRKEIEGDSSS